MTITTTAVICSECGTGKYLQSGDYFTCQHCGHEVDAALDVAPFLEPGESLVVRNGVLSVAGE